MDYRASYFWFCSLCSCGMIGMLLYPYFSTLISWVHVNLSQTVQKVEVFFVQKVEIECRKLKLNWLSASGELRVCQWNNRQLLYAICFFGKDEECTNRRKSQAIIVTIKPFWFQQPSFTRHLDPHTKKDWQSNMQNVLKQKH